MWAARERPFEELAEVEAAAPPDVAATEEGSPLDPHRGRFVRIALLVAVVGVEGAWLAFLLYAAWQLVTLVA